MYVTRFFFFCSFISELGLLSPFRRGCYECDCTNSPLCPASDSLWYVPRSVHRLLWYCGFFSLLGNHFWYFICDSSALAHGSVSPHDGLCYQLDRHRWAHACHFCPASSVLEFESERSVFRLSISTNVPWPWQVPLSLGSSFSTSPPMRKYN